ncbi:hypothetical protein QZM46_10680 [Burkholderia vietnamiensis]|uniref:hypothetical protein n=1 Tax=Burkholderia TaxID=32008 RepID=UPI0005DA425C|nr:MULTISPECIES: hypothetical protein [Burkholderia]AJY04338.1 hypothetical protein AK36_4580 [Burkholderia vietnamiensis LMG 10929]MCA7942937.1 hypothetical protein [Burkholderia vietnamiensis]MCA7983091.1 hypothetical protein [Burkholderia vietnamiensis]MCA8015058.1 hypothetical protein [Burkholderia vietnamiensis]MCA8068971.1 hypothetical protein [Burkholderia vietnamiensis]
MSEPLTVIVPRGTKVAVKEVDALQTVDPRAGADRHALIVGGADLKIAIAKHADGQPLSARAAFMTMCG